MDDLFESIPQIIIQSINNDMRDTWSFTAIFSIVMAGLSIFYHVLKGIHVLIDKRTLYEELLATHQTELSKEQKTTKRLATFQAEGFKRKSKNTVEFFRKLKQTLGDSTSELKIRSSFDETIHSVYVKVQEINTLVSFYEDSIEKHFEAVLTATSWFSGIPIGQMIQHEVDYLQQFFEALEKEEGWFEQFPEAVITAFNDSVEAWNSSDSFKHFEN
jgi:hypothetical protein